MNIEMRGLRRWLCVVVRNFDEEERVAVDVDGSWGSEFGNMVGMLRWGWVGDGIEYLILKGCE